ncbi:sn-glycerol-3-phosphate ABC transporter ATP-binding protein UgpC [Mesorhizobium sp. CU2]|uniref:ABC transporter ATP-binding protein n=1 Tax=unclassified Mesorhizobium TaxID=325217 RepID=UPI001128AA67|nr:MULTISPECIES: sn-glycerol-3-phosphate ABC transporter ATP-binding protein UgpC [unclassified Mesorhizobium]TPN81065.1 sn-glycerol-3-phosphate ABC transporter ATP-binding protein UgpC [Mesorhizobium sp. CU3]TPO09820.1 sn-glycerol-3-phosphate ABC transporter ATP-binding protein UgpC [Mesorhizobium sp. CU2]
MSSVRIENASKAYGGLKILHEVSVDVADGEFVVLVGPSGCGKSTLLRMIAGLENVTSGTISIGEKVVNNVLPKDRDIAMVFQSYALYPHMTVAENMAFSLMLKKASRQQIAAKVGPAAQILGLTPLLDRYPRQLSGGQRQRVAMGRAIVRDPQVFLFDEPLSNLDANLRVTMRGEIRALHQKLGTTTVYVTHDQVEAMTMADKIVVMREGRIEQVGHPLELYDQPRNMFVGGFIGSPSMNFLEATLDEASLTIGGIALRRPETMPNVDAATVICGIRPEHFELRDDGVPMEVAVVEPLGSETQVIGTIAGQSLVCILKQRLRARQGEILYLAPQTDKVIYFDKSTQVNIGI